MPIARRQFEAGIDAKTEEWMRAIYQHLDSNTNLAFSLQELGRALGLSGFPDYRNPVEVALADPRIRLNEEEQRFVFALVRLVELGVASERDVAGVAYYATGRYALPEILEPESKAS